MKIKITAMLLALVMVLVMIPLTALAANSDAENGDWGEKTVTLKNTGEAELMVRVGDIDNCNSGYEADYNPFTAKAQTRHGYPWDPDPSDPDGTDRIMLGSSFNGKARDGYSNYFDNSAPGKTLARPIKMTYDASGVTVKSALLQILVDDFQAPTWDSKFTVTINGKDAPFVAEVINHISQTGPTAYICSVDIPQSFFKDIESGSLSILIDDATTGKGDGFAIDFVKLLVNYTRSKYISTVNGTVLTGATPVSDATVRVLGTKNTVATNSSGGFTAEVIGGLNVFRASKDGYKESYEFCVVPAGKTLTLKEVTPNRNEAIYLNKGTGTPDIDYWAFTDGNSWSSSPQPATPTPQPTTTPTQPATPQPTTPATQPTGKFTLTATPVGESEAFAGVELNWTALPNVTHYRIFRAEKSGGYTIPLTDFDIQGNTFTDVNIASQKTYYYIVKPVLKHSDDGNDTLGEASNEASAFIPLAMYGNAGSSSGAAGGSSYIRMKVDSTTINVNGTNKQIDTAPVIVNGRTMVPARAIVEGMNGTAEWNAGTQQVTLKALGKTVVMTIGKTEYTIDGVQKTMDVPPVVKDGRTLIPLRFAGEALGCKVNWLQKTREILIVFSLTGAAISQPLATATTQPAATTMPTTQPAQQTGAVDKNLVGFWGGGTSDQGSGSYIAFADDGNFMYALVLVEANMSIFFEGKYACANGTINMTNVNMSMYEGESTTPTQQETGGSESHAYSVSGDKLVVNLHESDAEAWNHFSKITDPAQIFGTAAAVTQPSTESQPTQPAKPSTQPTQQSGSVVGMWSDNSSTFESVSYDGNHYFTSWYKRQYEFRADGTYEFRYGARTQFVSGIAVSKGKYTVSGNRITFSNCTEAWIPWDGSKAYGDKPVSDDTPLVFYFENGTLYLADDYGNGYPSYKAYNPVN